MIAKDGVIFIEYAKQLQVTPSQTILREYQHPGYPVLILAANKITGLVCKDKLFSLIYSSQGAALLFRILAIIVLYVLGKDLVGSRNSFWTLLILILLPKPAEYGSDALSDWPHMFFLAIGMLLLIRGAVSGKWWILGLAGLAGGLGYLVRPEGAQVVIYGFLWLGLQLFWKKRTMVKSKAVLALAAMLFFFIIIAGPYMKFKGAIFPKKEVGTFSSVTHLDDVETKLSLSNRIYHSGIIPSEVAGAVVKIFENIGDTLMWFFLLSYLIGIFLHFKKNKPLEPNQFFIIVLVIINILIMVWLYSSHGYMSGRHTLPLVVFTMFYIPTGLQALASGLNSKFSRGYEHSHRWFAILMVIGIAVCVPKLLKPLHYDKLAFRRAAQWLAQNTESSAILAVPDYRISFYAERQSIKMLDETIPDAAQYVVKLFSAKDGEQELKQEQQFEKLMPTESDDNKGFVIYKRIFP